MPRMCRPHRLNRQRRPPVDAGDTAWMLVSTGLVMFMVPGLALFYGGMVRRKNVLGTMMHSMVALGLIGVQWVLFGYALAFGDHARTASSAGTPTTSASTASHPDGLLSRHATSRSSSTACIRACSPSSRRPSSAAPWPSASASGRTASSSSCGCPGLLSAGPLGLGRGAVDCRLAGNPATSEAVGWLGRMGALDFAGGTVVHIAAGFSGLAAILVLRKRLGYPEHAIHPNSMVLTLTGAGLLWFGWFGFNGGSALGSGPLAGSALAAYAGRGGRGGAELDGRRMAAPRQADRPRLGVRAGRRLVAVTPAVRLRLAAGRPVHRPDRRRRLLRLGLPQAVLQVRRFARRLWRPRRRRLPRRSLTGVFVSAWIFNSGNGYPGSTRLGQLASGRAAQVGVQALAAVCAAGYSFVMTVVLVKIIAVWGFSLSAKAENEGLDEPTRRSRLRPRAGPGAGAGDDDEQSRGRPRSRPTANSASPSPSRRRRRTLMHAWSEMCQAGSQPPPEFRAVYPFVTTVRDGRFRFRGGDPAAMRDKLEQLSAAASERGAGGRREIGRLGSIPVAGNTHRSESPAASGRLRSQKAYVRPGSAELRCSALRLSQSSKRVGPRRG